jgi:multidrug efflux pump subunit AcrA (membrane-fusion protein)
MSNSQEENDRYVFLSWGARSFISAPSSKVLGASVVLIFLSICFSLIASFYIEIDLVVKTRGQTNSLLGIKDAVALVNGQIESLSVRDGEFVKEGQIIGRLRIEGASENELGRSIQLLKNQINLCQATNCTGERFSLDLVGIVDPSLREHIADVNQKFSSYHYTHTELKMKTLTELDPLRDRQKLIVGKLNFLENSRMKKYLLMQREALEEENGRITQQITNLSNQIEERIHQSKSEAIHALRLAMFSFESFLLKHQIKSPVSGKISRLNKTQGSFVSLHEPILSIVPVSSPIISEAVVLTKDIGKVSRGNKVILSIDAFPPHRYGYFHGTVIGIEHIKGTEAKPDHYLAKVEFDLTSPSKRSPAFDKIVKIVPGMQTEVRIISRREAVSSIILDKILGTGE